MSGLQQFRQQQFQGGQIGLFFEGRDGDGAGDSPGVAENGGGGAIGEGFVFSAVRCPALLPNVVEDTQECLAVRDCILGEWFEVGLNEDPVTLLRGEIGEDRLADASRVDDDESTGWGIERDGVWRFDFVHIDQMARLRDCELDGVAYSFAESKNIGMHEGAQIELLECRLGRVNGGNVSGGIRLPDGVG